MCSAYGAASPAAQVPRSASHLCETDSTFYI